MELLKTDSKGYPADYLFSRLRGRRVFFITEWIPLLYSPHPLEDLRSSHYRYVFEEHSAEGIGHWLTSEFRWVYYQMNRKMQIIFFPFFLYYEIEQTLFPFFRNSFRKNREDAAGKLLNKSLFSDRVITVLKRRDYPFVVEGIEALFLTLSDRFKGMKALFSAPDRLLTFEQMFMHAYFEHTIHSHIHPVLQQFFVLLIDMRNIRTLLKHVRWHIPGAPSFVCGGYIDTARLKKLFDRNDVHEIKSLVSGLTHVEIPEDDPALFEKALFRRLSKKVRQAARDPLGVGLILDYLWRCYLQALNLRLVLYRGGVKKEMLERSLIYE